MERRERLPQRGQGEIFVVSAPSGTGKTTLCREVCQAINALVYGVSHTTRPPRSGEIHGKDYFFVDDKAFQDMIDRGAFFEWATVYDYKYGTSRAWLQDRLVKGLDVIIDVDVQGANQLRKLNLPAHFIFIMPPSWQALKERLRARGTESSKEIERRLLWAKDELSYWKDYDFIITNADLETAKRDLESVVRARRCRLDRRRDWIERTVYSWIAERGSS